MGPQMSAYKIITLAATDPALNDYRAMIYSDFMKSLRYGNEWYRLIDSNRYYSVYKNIIDALLSRADSVVRLACLANDVDTCLGWSLTEGPKFHYIFVKEDYRRNGIGKSLMPKEFNQITHLTKIGQAIRKAKFRTVIFDPF